MFVRMEELFLTADFDASSVLRDANLSDGECDETMEEFERCVGPKWKIA